MDSRTVKRKPFRERSIRDRWRQPNYGLSACRKSDVDRIAMHMQDGVPFDVACDLVGIDHNEAFKWSERGFSYLRAADDQVALMPDHLVTLAERYAYFYVRITKAFALFKHDVVIEDIRGPGWARGISTLERRDPSNWGRLTPRGEDSGSKLETFDPDPSFL